MMRDADIALARTAAPASISNRATIKILTKSGYQVARDGDNGFVCIVMRGFSAPTYTPAQFRDLVYDPTVHAPILAPRHQPPAARCHITSCAPTRDGRKDAGPDRPKPRGQCTSEARSARDVKRFAYMWSAHQHLGSGIDAWHPHMMVFAPYYENAMVGGNAFGSPLPQVSDDAGTPFTVVVIPVDDKLAVN